MPRSADRTVRRRWGLVVATVALALVSAPVVGAQQAAPVQPVPRAACGPGSDPELGRQGRITNDDYAAHGDRPFTCNAALLGRHGDSGGFKTLRYIDGNGAECAFYDSTLLFGPSVFQNLATGEGAGGVYVLDMSDPSHPVQTAALTTPAMLSPHESLVLNERRGLLAAVMGNPVAYPGIVDIYDISQDCLHPRLLSSSPVGFLGHESGFSPDGNTFYASSLITGQVTAIDVTDPTVPTPIWLGEFSSHGVNLGSDGNRAYFAVLNVDGSAVVHGGLKPGLVVLDTTSIQAREPLPQPTIISKLEWEPASYPQAAFPVTIGGHPYVIEVDEFAGVLAPDTTETPGAARIIDIADETKPFVVSNIRLEVNQPEHIPEQQGDRGATDIIGGYSAHYCAVPRAVDPEILACSFVLSGLRVFDITDPAAPKELAYFNAPPSGGTSKAMSAAAFAPDRSEIWFTDGNTGFYVVRLTNGVWVNGEVGSAQGVPGASAAGQGSGRGTLAASGASIPGFLALIGIVGWLMTRRVRGRLG